MCIEIDAYVDMAPTQAPGFFAIESCILQNYRRQCGPEDLMRNFSRR